MLCVDIKLNVIFFLQEIVALVEQHQKTGEPEPISLLTMFTPSTLCVTESEFTLRGRAVQLGSRFDGDTSAVDAIAEIMRVYLF